MSKLQRCKLAIVRKKRRIVRKTVNHLFIFLFRPIISVNFIHVFVIIALLFSQKTFWIEIWVVVFSARGIISNIMKVLLCRSILHYSMDYDKLFKAEVCDFCASPNGILTII